MYGYRLNGRDVYLSYDMAEAQRIAPQRKIVNLTVRIKFPKTEKLLKQISREMGWKK